MVIIITGASHSGKTILAQKILERCKFPYLSIDHLKMGLIRSKNTNLTPYDDDALTPYLWNIVREIIKTVIENNQNLIVEGCYIPADWKQDFEQRYLTEIRFCCLCLSPKYIRTQYIRTHFSDIIRHASDIELRLDDSECTADWLEKENSRYAVFCKKNNLPLIMIETNYIEEIDALIPILTSGDIEAVRAEIKEYFKKSKNPIKEQTQ